MFSVPLKVRGPFPPVQSILIACSPATTGPSFRLAPCAEQPILCLGFGSDRFVDHDGHIKHFSFSRSKIANMLCINCKKSLHQMCLKSKKMLCTKCVYRSKKTFFYWPAGTNKPRFLYDPYSRHIACLVVILFEDSVHIRFRLTVLLRNRSGNLPSMPWCVRGTLVSLADIFVCMQSFPTPPCHFSQCPDPSRPSCVRVFLDMPFINGLHIYIQKQLAGTKPRTHHFGRVGEGHSVAATCRFRDAQRGKISGSQSCRSSRQRASRSCRRECSRAGKRQSKGSGSARGVGAGRSFGRFFSLCRVLMSFSGLEPN